MKNSLLSLLVAIMLTTAMSANAEECPSDDTFDTFLCSQDELAQQGDVDAQYILGWMYDMGGDTREAVRWYRKAAEQGHVDAQYTLGGMYDIGIGADKREVVRWYRKAAEQGHVDAQYKLGLMYYFGEGVITDNREAYIWLSIAKANGDEKAADIVREINLDLFLTTTEIKSAQREAAWRLEAIEQDNTASTVHGNSGGNPLPNGGSGSNVILPDSFVNSGQQAQPAQPALGYGINFGSKPVTPKREPEPKDPNSNVSDTLEAAGIRLDKLQAGNAAERQALLGQPESVPPAQSAGQPATQLTTQATSTAEAPKLRLPNRQQQQQQQVAPQGAILEQLNSRRDQLAAHHAYLMTIDDYEGRIVVAQQVEAIDAQMWNAIYKQSAFNLQKGDTNMAVGTYRRLSQDPTANLQPRSDGKYNIISKGKSVQVVSVDQLVTMFTQAGSSYSPDQANKAFEHRLGLERITHQGNTDILIKDAEQASGRILEVLKASNLIATDNNVAKNDIAKALVDGDIAKVQSLIDNNLKTGQKLTAAQIAMVQSVVDNAFLSKDNDN